MCYTQPSVALGPAVASWLNNHAGGWWMSLRAAWKTYRQSEEQVVLQLGEVRRDAKGEGAQRGTEEIH